MAKHSEGICSKKVIGGSDEEGIGTAFSPCEIDKRMSRTTLTEFIKKDTMVNNIPEIIFNRPKGID